MMISARMKKMLNVLVHILIFAGVLLCSFVLKYDYDFIREQQAAIATFVLFAITTKVAVFALTGMFTGWWRYVSLHDLGALVRANLGATILLIIAVAFGSELFPEAMVVSLSVLVIDASLCFLFTAGVRILVRFVSEKRCQFEKHRKKALKRVLVVGAGAIGQTIVREIRQCTRVNQKVVGFVDNDPQRQNQSFQGVPVLGSQDDLERICCHRNINTVIVARSALCPKSLRQIVDRCQSANVQVKILPAMGDILNGDVTIQKIRDIQIEDLLGRTPIGLEAQSVSSLVQGQVVLVTGAGGSIGSEICRQVSGLLPATLVLLDHGETPLFYIEREVKKQGPQIAVNAVLGDVRDADTVNELFRKFTPTVIFHAAAYKHVGMSEKNPAQAIQNNVFGTLNVARAAHDFGAQTFVQISTDKAVNPTNIMGATKRFAERVVQSLSRASRVQYITVRFGNVLGSNGSVVEVFKEQIARGGPLSVTHPEVTRFFMTIQEAVNLVLHAGLIGKGGDVYLLDMGEPVKILSLAEEMIRMSGLRPYEDIDIEFSGLAPGEKLYEELLLAEEGAQPTRHEKIWSARPSRIDGKKLKQALATLETCFAAHDESAMLREMLRIVPEYLNDDPGQLPPVTPEGGDDFHKPFVPPYMAGGIRRGVTVSAPNLSARI